MKSLPSGPAVTINITRGPHVGRQLRFTDHQTCIVGRAREAHLRLSPNREFSRFHCRLEIRPPDVHVVDLKSTNGTWVNGRNVEHAVLNNGDEVSVGDTAFVIGIDLPTSVGAKLIESTRRQVRIADPSVTEEEMDVEETPRFPGYTVERQIGHGSMGTVYSARRTSTNERVAIKVVRPVVATDERAVDKFRREAAIVLRLQHKRIVRSLDFRLTDHHLPFLVMEYIDEVGIREILKAASLSERTRMAAGIIMRALDGLQYAHEMEIVHRDVKPGNLLVYRAGRKLQVKVADFGLAKNYIDAGFSDCSASDEICGTLAYMPPEQIIDCRHAKPACDIYAAGVCLYNMISGRLPYEADTIAQQISLILNRPPTPLTEYVPDVAPGVAAIIQRAMEREASQRFATAEAMEQALLPFTRRQ
ncbi:MAG: FHA domain-containing serine/threonine-protein kinase [Planctomycetaceae bacterium]